MLSMTRPRFNDHYLNTTLQPDDLITGKSAALIGRMPPAAVGHGYAERASANLQASSRGLFSTNTWVRLRIQPA